MASITTRETASGVGDRAGITNNAGPLSNAQIDQNFIELNNDKLEESDAVSTNTADSVVKRDSDGGFAMGDLDATYIRLTPRAGTNPEITFKNNSDSGIDYGIRINGETLEFYEPEDTNKVHMILGDDNGVDIKYGLTIAGTSMIDTSLNLGNVKSLGVGTTASGTTGQVRATNSITSYYSSDERLKENIKNIENPLEKVNQLNGVEYDWKDSYIESQGGEDGYFVRKHDVGLIAQEVEKILPEIVAENNEGYKAIKYERVVALLVEAVKELNKEVKQLRNAQ